MADVSLKKQRGFTLIELVVVMIILAVLAIIALPKFINLRNDAMMATMDELKGAIETAEQLTYAKAAIDGVDSQASANIIVDGQSITVTYGYPAVAARSAANDNIDNGTVLNAEGLLQLIDIPNGWKSRHSTLSGTNAWVFWPEIIPIDAGAAQCFLRYHESTGVGQKPVLDYVTSGCSDY